MPPASSLKRSSSRAANPSTPKAGTRAAASSIASGMPSRRRQIAAAAAMTRPSAAVARLRGKGRDTNSRSAPERISPRGPRCPPPAHRAAGPGRSVRPGTRSGSRLVTIRVRPGLARSSDFRHAGRRLDQMLAVVEDQQELLDADRRRDSFGRRRLASRVRPSARATVAGTSQDRKAGRAPRSTRRRETRQKSAPALDAQSGLADAASTARVTSRYSAARAVTSLSSASRPINSETRSGRFVTRAGGGPRPWQPSHGFRPELIAVSGHSPDEIAIGAKDLSEHGDLGRQVIFLDDPVRPDAAHELVLAEDLPRASMRAISVSNARPPSSATRPSASSSRRWGTTLNLRNSILTGSSGGPALVADCSPGIQNFS